MEKPWTLSSSSPFWPAAQAAQVANMINEVRSDGE